MDGAWVEAGLMLVMEGLDEGTFEGAGALVAREQAAGRRVRAELPADFGSAEVCAAGLRRLCEDGHGLVATENGRAVAVMAATVRENPVVGRYALLLAEGFAAEPELADPTAVLAVAFGELAAPLIADGVLRYYLDRRRVGLAQDAPEADGRKATLLQLR